VWGTYCPTSPPKRLGNRFPSHLSSVHSTSRSQVALPRSPVSGTWKSADLRRLQTAYHYHTHMIQCILVQKERSISIAGTATRQCWYGKNSACQPEVDTGVDMCQIHVLITLSKGCYLVRDEQKNHHALFPRQIAASLSEAFWDPARAEDLKAPSARSRGREMPKNMHAGNLAHLATRSLEQAQDETQLLRSRAHFELVMNSTLALRELRILELRTLHRPARASHRSL
jgi:hypothetical protein